MFLYLDQNIGSPHPSTVQYIDQGLDQGYGHELHHVEFATIPKEVGQIGVLYDSAAPSPVYTEERYNAVAKRLSLHNPTNSPAMLKYKPTATLIPAR